MSECFALLFGDLVFSTRKQLNLLVGKCAFSFSRPNGWLHQEFFSGIFLPRMANHIDQHSTTLPLSIEECTVSFGEAIGIWIVCSVLPSSSSNFCCCNCSMQCVKWSKLKFWLCGTKRKWGAKLWLCGLVGEGGVFCSAKGARSKKEHSGVEKEVDARKGGRRNCTYKCKVQRLADCCLQDCGVLKFKSTLASTF